MADDKISNTDKELLSMMERRQRLEEEKLGIAEDIKDIAKEAKAKGYDPKVYQAAYKRFIETADAKKAREQQEAELENYLAALGLL